MSQTSNLVQLALLIRRGQLSLKDVPEEAQPTVRSIMYSLTDAQCGLMAASQERHYRNSWRSHALQRARS